MLSPTSSPFEERQSPGFGSFDEHDPAWILDLQNQRVQSCLESVQYYLIEIKPMSEDAAKALKGNGSILNSPSNTERVQDLGKQLLKIPTLDAFRRTPLVESLNKAMESLESETP